MAGYELPVTRVPGLGSMDQIGAALGTGPATDYLGNIITSKLVTNHSDLSPLSGRALGPGPAPGSSLASPVSLSSSLQLATGKSSRPVSPPMIQVWREKTPPMIQVRQQTTLLPGDYYHRCLNEALSLTDGPHQSNTVSIKPLIVSSVSGDLTNCLTSQPRHPEAPLSLASPGRAQL